MSDLSQILALPLLHPAQAQKHVTHNEALVQLDALVQLSVSARDLSAPPASPAPGARYILPAGAGGAWAGEDGKVAVWDQGAWVFHAPLAGWRAWVEAETLLLVFDGVAWGPVPANLQPGDLQNLDPVGINTTADATNRLAVAADATLLSHDGTDHRLTVNKAGAGDTASLLFQSGWSGRAELGLTGSTDFALRVSPDGSAFSDALTTDATSGVVTLPNGLSFGADTLAHYAEGSWTPVLGFGGDSTGISYDVQSGTYLRIGNLVFLHCAIDLSARGSGVGDAEISGLPFAPTPLYYPGEVFFISGGAGLNAPKCRIVPGPKIKLVNPTSSGIQDLDEGNFTDTTNLKISILHMV